MTIGGMVVTGELFIVPATTVVSTLYATSGLLMWAFGGTEGEMRQHESMRAV
jgi:hypothetical protein